MRLEAAGISKSFHGVKALDRVNLSVEAGEVHGLIGENGAGKSTLIKILTGVYTKDEGALFMEGAPLHIRRPSDAVKAGICSIHQDHVLIPFFTGYENIYLGSDYPTKFGKIRWREMRAAADAKAAELGMEDLDLSRTASEMTPPERTCTEIVRAMMHDCRVLILDEPTASLTDREAELLFKIIDGLKRRGTALLYVSHRLDEIFRLTDRITVLRNGVPAGTVTTAETGREDLLTMMTEAWESRAENTERERGEELLAVEDLSTADGRVHSASLSLHRGEILGLFGLGGSGRTELLECIYGCRSRAGGHIRLRGELQEVRSPGRSLSCGMTLIPEDRRGRALAENLSIRDNMLLTSIDRFARGGILRRSEAERAVAEKIGALAIRQTGADQLTRELSGGNQQKVVLARALMTEPEIWLCDEPTQAVDVRTRAEIHDLLRKEAGRGRAVLYVTSDLKEMLEIADRILIIAQGETGAVLENKGLTAPQVLAHCYKGKKD